MYTHHLQEMARALVSAGLIALKDQEKAQDVLGNQWQSKIAISWCVNDVHTAANKAGRAISDDIATEILLDAHRNHDAEQGLNWDVLQELVGSQGRKLTDDEVDAFVAAGDPIKDESGN